MIDNKKFVKECLYALVKHGKAYELDKLTDPDFCTKTFSIEWKDDGINCTVLKFYDPKIAVADQIKDSSNQQRYYPEPIILFGTRYLVYNNWLDSEHSPIRRQFYAWVKDVIFPELSDLEDILNA